MDHVKFPFIDQCFQLLIATDIAKAKDVLLAVAESCPEILQEPQPVAVVKAHDSSAILIDLKVWCRTDEYYNVRSFLLEQVKMAFDEANITIPYPRMDVRVTK